MKIQSYKPHPDYQENNTRDKMSLNEISIDKNCFALLHDFLCIHTLTKQKLYSKPWKVTTVIIKIKNN